VDIEVESVDEVRYYIKTEKGIKQELRDYFSFMVPGAQYMPMFKRRIWDGKIRLYDILTSTLPRGLKTYLDKFSQDRKYSLNIKENRNPLCIKETQLAQFYDTLAVSVKKKPVQMHAHQQQAIMHALNHHRYWFGQKFDNLRLGPFSTIRLIAKSKNFDSRTNSWSRESNGF
jgi:hypothetical protein